MRPRQLTLLIILVFTFAGVSCRKIMPERYAGYSPSTRVHVDLPSATKNSDVDARIDKEDSVVVSLPNNEGVYLGKTQYSKETFGLKLHELLQKQTDPEALVYIAAGASSDYASVIWVLDQIRRENRARVGLIVTRLPDNGPARFIVDIPAEPDPKELERRKLNPLTLVVALTLDLNLKLNQDPIGSLADTEVLAQKLTQIFRLRTGQYAFKRGLDKRTDLPMSERIEKTLIINPDHSSKYGDVIKLIDAVKGAGASPIVLQIDDFTPIF